MTYICQSNDWGRWVFVVIKSKYKPSAKKKLMEFSSQFDPPLTNWIFVKFKDNEPAITGFLETHQFEQLYEAQYGSNQEITDGGLIRVAHA